MTDIKDIGGIAVHPAADLFPMLGDKQHAELVADIRKNGLRTCLIFLGRTMETAQLLDGRNRLKAIQEIGGIDIRDHSDLIDDCELDDPVGYVLSLNLHRRHLTESQLSVVAGRAANLKHGTNRHEKKVEGPTGPSTPAPMTIKEAAKAVDISERTAKRGKAIVDKGTPELIAAVEDGKLKANAAAKIAKLPKAEQAAALATALAPKPPKAPKPKAEPVAKAATLQPLMALRAIYNATSFAESRAVRVFADWVCEQIDSNTINIETIRMGCEMWRKPE